MSVRWCLGLSLAIALAFAAAHTGAEPRSAAIRAGGDWTRFGHDAARHNSGPASTGITVIRLPSGPGHWNSPIVGDGRIALPEGDANQHQTSGVLDIYRLP